MVKPSGLPITLKCTSVYTQVRPTWTVACAHQSVHKHVRRAIWTELYFTKPIKQKLRFIILHSIIYSNIILFWSYCITMIVKRYMIIHNPNFSLICCVHYTCSKILYWHQAQIWKYCFYFHYYYYFFFYLMFKSLALVLFYSTWMSYIMFPFR